MKKNKNGITLVSLVITIVIMLILAGVSISLIIGNNGLFTKSKDSAKTYNESSVKEELQVVSNNIYLENKDEITNIDIANAMSQDLKDIEWQDRSLLAGIYKGYDFYIDNNKKVIMEKLNIEPIVMKNVILNNEAYTADKLSIKNVYILVNSNPTYPSDSIADKRWDVSQNQDGSIIAYFKNSDTASIPYDLYIVGKRTITLPENSSGFFKDFWYTYKINGFENVDTSKVTDMSTMFQQFGYFVISSFELPDSFDTSNVTNMDSMFINLGYKGIHSVKLGRKFDTKKVTTMNGMFFQIGYDAGGDLSIDLGPSFNADNANCNNCFNTIRSNFTIYCSEAASVKLKTVVTPTRVSVKY